LKRYVNGNWVTYKSWSNTEYLNVCTVLEDYYVPSGYSYKLYVYGYAWVNGVLVDTPIIPIQFTTENGSVDEQPIDSSYFTTLYHIIMTITSPL